MTTKPFSWTPHTITGVHATEDEPRTGYIGRAAALSIGGVESIVLCRNEADLEKVGKHLMGANHFDINLIYKATLIHSAGIAIRLPEEPEEVEETPAAAPIEPEVVPTPPLNPEMPVRGDDGVPVVTYSPEPVEMVSDAKVALESKQVEEDDDEL